MNLFKKTITALIILGSWIGVASAQNATWSSPTITVGATTVDVMLNFDTMGATVQGYGVNTTYDNTNLVFVSCTSSATTCDDLAGGNSGTVNIGSIGAPGGNPIVTLTFNTSSTPTGMYNIASPGATYVDAAFADQPLPVTTGVITVSPGPQPDWSSTPAGGSTLTFTTVIAGAANQTQTVDVTNTGAAGSTLTSTCSLLGADAAKFSIVSGGSVSLAQNATSTITVDCDASVAGNFTAASLDCPHNGDGTTTATPANYPLSCTVSPPGAAQYASTPADGSPVNMTTGLGVPVGATAPTGSIAITNPAPNASDNDLGLEACTYAGDAAITVTSADPLTTSLAPQSAATATVNFSCSTAAVGMFTGTYSCPFSTDGAAGPEGTATYPVNCDVRAAAATGSQNPVDMTPINFVAPPGSFISSSVTFSEVGGEGVDITDLNCSLATGTDFVITSPAAFPATVPAAGSLPVVVTFTDPAVAGPFTDTLTCTYTDASGPVSVSYPLSGTVRAIVVPALSWVGYTAMMFGLLLIGFFGFRRKA